jgi:hypothetical protein
MLAIWEAHSEGLSSIPMDDYTTYVPTTAGVAQSVQKLGYRLDVRRSIPASRPVVRLTSLLSTGYQGLFPLE